MTTAVETLHISNKASLHQEHRCVAKGLDGSDKLVPSDGESNAPC